MEKRANAIAHVLVVPYPSQGHINPMLQFCRRLASKGVKATLAITKYISNALNNPTSDGQVSLATISDGYDKGGFFEAEGIEDYLANLMTAGSHSIGHLIEEHAVTPHPITCIVYDSFLPWALDAARKYNILEGPFFTQACAVNYIYYLIHHGKLHVPVSSPVVEVPGLPPLGVDDLPSFAKLPRSYPAYFEMVQRQFSNSDTTDFMLVNTFYELEDKVIDEMSRQCPLLTIGPTVPSIYLDNRIEEDRNYGISLYQVESNTSTVWLSTKPPRSVVYVSFGSMADLSKEQMEELAWGLKDSGCYFLWVVRASEESKLPRGFINETSEKGLISRWCSQLEVLASESIGCFFTHCGWNSTLEALALGVPLIGMPQWTDQPTDAKFIQDIWKAGVRVKEDDKGLVTRKEIADCIQQLMVGARREEMIENAKRWKDLAKKAVSQGGSSDRNIEEFISKIA